MSTPLRPQSPQTLNRMANQSPSYKSSPLKAVYSPPSTTPTSDRKTSNKSSLLGSKTSSPFESDVGIGQENVAPDHYGFPALQSPSKQSSNRPSVSPNKRFEIYDEEEQKQEPDWEAASTITFSTTQQSERKASLSRRDMEKDADLRFSPSKATASLGTEEQLGGRRSSADLIDPPNTEVEDYEENTVDAASFVSDDTRFSAFSAVPNVDMTQFAALGYRGSEHTLKSPIRSPYKGLNVTDTPAGSVYGTPKTSHRRLHDARAGSPSPTPRRQQPMSSCEETTSLLLDFTQQFEKAARNSQASSPTKQASRSPTKTITEPNLLSFINNQRMPSPAKNAPATPGGTRRMLNLLDFDLPPQPTPRSIPTITVRELETLKSQYLSEISSLKASLSGREAEVDSLKKAKNDAERRVGEALESVREERSAREHAEKEKAEWEKKGKEVESVLKTVKEEYLEMERERDDAIQKLDEANRLREEAEIKAAEALTRAAVASGEGSDGGSVATSATEALVAQRVAQQIDEKMESLARELHGVYKKKHETKVATLKKTYEARSEKKCAELQSKIDELTKQTEELLAAKDATFSDELPPGLQASSVENTAQLRQLEEQKNELNEQQARIARLAEELKAMQQNHAQLLGDLEHERIEKGELVAAVDEMLTLQSEVGAPNAIEDFRRSISISRPQSAIARPVDVNGGSRLARPSSGLPTAGKSSMMNKLQRMGSSRGE